MVASVRIKEGIKVSKTNLGRFLYSERIRRGYESTSEYLKNYANIPISESYYRDIESGRKTIKVDKAETLCKALKLDKREFYYHILSNILPSDVLKEILKPIDNTSFESPSEEFEKINQQMSVLRKAYEKRLIEEPYIVDTEIVKYLEENFEVLPLIHFIYMKKICSFKELEEIISKNCIKKPFEQMIDEFEKSNIAIVDRKEKTVTRHRKIFRIPRTDVGIRFKDKFIKSEIDETIRMSNREQIIGPDNTFAYSSIVCIEHGDSLNRISDKLTDLLAELEVEESSLDEEGTTPYFISVIFSSREKYTINKNKRR